MQNKRRRNKSSKFIPNLHKILNDNDSGAHWRSDQKSFVLSDMSRVISNSLPKYFRHTNISSFIRQLNLYGFKKLTGDKVPQNTYYHPKFKKNQLIQLKPLKSFYNQEKYGTFVKQNIEQLKVQQRLKQQENSEYPTYEKVNVQTENSDSILSKQKLYIKQLQQENQRLKIIQRQYQTLLNSLKIYNQSNYQSGYLKYYNPGIQFPLQGPMLPAQNLSGQNYMNYMSGNSYFPAQLKSQYQTYTKYQYFQ